MKDSGDPELQGGVYAVDGCVAISYFTGPGNRVRADHRGFQSEGARVLAGDPSIGRRSGGGVFAFLGLMNVATSWEG